MGMFDDITCKYPLPIESANALAYQTKDTPEQFLDMYEIREDGTLWHESYDIEDHSERGKWKAAHPGEEPPVELDGMIGCMARVNKCWAWQSTFTGEISFYTICNLIDGKLVNATRGGWIQWSAYFVDGKMNQIHLTENRAPE